MFYNYGRDFMKIFSYIKKSKLKINDWDLIIDKIINLWSYKYNSFIKDIDFISIRDAIKYLCKLHKRGVYPEGFFVLDRKTSIESIKNIIISKKIIDQNTSYNEIIDFSKSLKAGVYAYYFLSAASYHEMCEIVNFIPNNKKRKELIYKILLQMLYISYLGRLWYDFVETRKDHTGWYHEALEEIKKNITNNGFNYNDVLEAKIPYVKIDNYYEPIPKGFEEFKFHHPDYINFNNDNTVDGDTLYQMIKHIFVSAFPVTIEGPSGFGKSEIIKRGLEDIEKGRLYELKDIEDLLK